MPATDYTQTNNPRSLHLAELARPFPEWIKGSPIPVSEGLEKLADVAFASRAQRLLPIHTKEAVFFSAIDYFAHADQYPADTFGAIKEACEHFAIGPDVAPYADVFVGVFEKAASAAEPSAPIGRFAIETHLNGHEFRLLPINDSYEVSKAASDLKLMVDERRIHYLMFVDAAREIVKAATEIGADTPLPAVIDSVGALRFPDFEKAARLIESRRSVVAAHEGAYEAYTGTLAEAIAGAITADACMQKLAAIDDALDVAYNYSDRTRVPLPHTIVFGGPRVSDVEKAAAERVMVRDVPLPLTVVRKIPTIDIQFHLEKEAAQELLEMRDSGGAIPISLAVAQWNEPDQKALLRLAVANG